MKIKTSELNGDALVWAVATCEGYTDLHKIEGRMPHEPQLAMMPPRRAYGAVELWEIGSGSDWGFFGPIIERECMEFDYDEATQIYHAYNGVHGGQGKTHLIAAMRCFVASRLGDEVDVPEELMEGEK